MMIVAALSLALAFGLAAGGFAASLAQQLTGLLPLFRAPFVREERLGASLALTALIGPYMLFNEALLARREARIGSALVAVSGAMALGWALSSGIVLTYFAGQIVATVT